MWKYAARRILWAIPTILIATILLFLVLRILPGDLATRILLGPDGEGVFTEQAVQELRARLGLDAPVHIQYVRWLGDTIRGDLGSSLYNHRPVLQELRERLPLTVQLAIMGQVLAVLIGIPIGVLAALKRDSLVDNIVRGGSIVFLSLPSFWVAILFLMAASALFRWGPPLGHHSLWESPWENLQQLLPAASILALNIGAVASRFTRSAMLEVLGEDYIRTARAKGLSPRTVTVDHALRNALIPVVTFIAVSFANLLSGTIVLEVVFSLPGVGFYLFGAIRNYDFPVVQAVFLFAIVVVITINLIVDLLYAWLDPRIAYS